MSLKNCSNIFSTKQPAKKKKEVLSVLVKKMKIVMNQID